MEFRKDGLGKIKIESKKVKRTENYLSGKSKAQIFKNWIPHRVRNDMNMIVNGYLKKRSQLPAFGGKSEARISKSGTYGFEKQTQSTGLSPVVLSGVEGSNMNDFAKQSQFVSGANECKHT